METKLVIAGLAALAQESRLAVFRLLVQTGPEGLAASKISEQLAIPPSSLSFHLKELSHAGLLDSRQSGRYIFYYANIAVMTQMLNYLTDNCCNGQVCTPAIADLCPPSCPY